MTLEEKVQVLANQLGLTKSAIAERAGISKSAFSGGFNITYRNLLKLFEAFPQVNANWIFKDIGEPLGSEEGGYISLPFISVKASAGYMDRFNDEKELSESYVVSPGLLGGYAPKSDWCVIEISGNSMDPTIKNGDKVLVRKVESLEFATPGVYAVVFSDQFVVKRLKTNQISTDGKLLLISDNVELAGPLLISANEIRGLWKVFKVVESTVT